jgi:hypothetical protein
MQNFSDRIHIIFIITLTPEFHLQGRSPKGVPPNGPAWGTPRGVPNSVAESGPARGSTKWSHRKGVPNGRPPRWVRKAGHPMGSPKVVHLVWSPRGFPEACSTGCLPGWTPRGLQQGFPFICTRGGPQGIP